MEEVVALILFLFNRLIIGFFWDGRGPPPDSAKLPFLNDLAPGFSQLGRKLAGNFNNNLVMLTGNPRCGFLWHE
jgi:hypothetical protein